MNWRGAWQLSRPLPLAIWSIPTVLMGFFLQQGAHVPHEGISLALAMIGAMLLQGFVTHGLNDLYDWDSGTDQATTGIISGGSRVLVHGLLTARQIWWLVGAGTLGYIVTAIGLIALRGDGVGIWAILALFGAVAYSVPPARWSYRPFAGEWGALFPTMVSGVVLGAMAKNPQLSSTVYIGAGVYGLYCVASVMQHHLTDMDADWQAHPPKRTTPAYWWRQKHRSPLEIILAYQGLGIIVCLLGLYSDPRIFGAWAGIFAVAMLITALTPWHDDPWSLTRRDVALKLLAIIGVMSIAH
ncbi:MAG: prenyltransferase [Sulfobacillus thermotolerans]|uniref:Prenyltransferase n=1 Tax=Sulfobacillus thermotolerans TaxID=338644 RepID=A0ABM6RRV9_9FIRM|nr:hypothetical protein BXT84_08980 [Sulfobacillus thermotolerans]MCY0907763.1 prenyltransferase [Sulfobacillus thermotolerans]